MKIRSFLTVFILAIFSFQSCGEAKADEVKLISVEEMKSHLKMEEVQLLDVRSQSDYSTSHILNASNIVLDKDFEKNIDSLDRSKPVMVYCATGVTSKRAVEILRNSGFEKIYELDGGIAKWVREGEEVN